MPKQPNPQTVEISKAQRRAHLWGYFKTYGSWFLGGAIALVLTNLLGLAIPAQIGDAVQTLKDAGTNGFDEATRSGLVLMGGTIIALAIGAPLYTTHAVEGRYSIVEMPRANDLLERWNAGPLRHHTINHACCDGTVDTLLDAMKTVDPDLLVVGKREGDSIIDHLLEESVSEALARNLPIPTLVIPSLSSGFVNPRTGETTIEHVLEEFSPAEEIQLVARIDMAVQALEACIVDGVDAAMSGFNSEPAPGD